MKFKNFILLAILVAFISIECVAQVSFNKRAMGTVGSTPKAGDFFTGASLENVDMTTGTLKIGIPLYEIKVNDISVPISLNYSALGIKVGQEAGAPGMGWDLSAGGKIITNVQGKPDGTPFTGMRAKYISGDTIPGTVTNDFLKQVVNGERDNAWDTYTYVLPTKGGSYASDYTHDGLTFPYDPMSRIQHKDGQPHTITTDGLVYTFVNGDRRQTAKISNYKAAPGGISPTLTVLKDSSWTDYDLYTIKSLRFNDVVNFKYDSFGAETDTARMSAKKRTNISESLPLYREVTQSSFDLTGWLFSDDAHDDEKYEVREPFISKTETKYLQHTRLKEIDFPTGKVTFDYTSDDVLGRDRLSNVKIFKKVGSTLLQLKRYAFYYNESYYAYGHYLDSVKIFDSKNERQGVWKFTYKDGPLPVAPNVLSKAQDRWGFFNGQFGNKTLLERLDSCIAWKAFPHYPIDGSLIKYTRDENYTYYGGAGSLVTPGLSDSDRWKIGEAYKSISFASRSFVFSQAVKGTLNSITTPTGALYEYEYEPHKLTSPTYDGNLPGSVPFSAATSQTGGGIRVKSITKKMGHESLYYGMSTTESAAKKTYQYGSAVEADPIQTVKEKDGKGEAFIPQNILSNESVYYDSRAVYPNPDSYKYKRIDNFILVSHPINNLVINNGSYVMYKSVTEFVYQLPLYSGTDSTYINKTHGKTVFYNNPPMFDMYPYGYPGESPAGLYGWRYYYSGNKDYPLSAPLYLSTETSISAETGAGTYAINKYEFRDSLQEYKMAEKIKYKFKLYKNPDAVPAFKNIYASLAGQIVGQIPVEPGMPGPPRVTSSDTDNRGLSTINPPEFFSLLIGGSMNYFTASYLMDENASPDYPYKYVSSVLRLRDFSYCMRKVEEVRIEGSLDGLPASELYTEYEYANKSHMLPTTVYTHPRRKSYYDFELDEYFEYISEYNKRYLYYPEDVYLLGSTYDFSYWKDTRQSLDEPLAEYVISQKEGSVANPILIDLTLNTFIDDNGAIVPYKTWKLTGNDDYIQGYLPSITNTWNGTAPAASAFKEQVSYDGYFKGQLHQYTELDKKSTVVLWGYNNQYPIAKIVNTGKLLNTFQPGGSGPSTYFNSGVAYTSFETRDTCNWLYGNNIVTDTSTISGKKAYNLGAGNITKVNATVAGNYILAYWYKTGAVVNATGGTIGAEVIKNQLGPWIYAEREVNNVSGVLTISGSGNIDELRFYPKDAQMTTFLYEPLIGLSSTIDANGRPQYYEYDDSQRLKQIRDHKGNIIKAYKYIIGSAN